MAEVDNELSHFLSKMPDDVLVSIISSFGIRNVAKLRTLGRRWRYMRPSNSNLEFDKDSVLEGDFFDLLKRKREFVHGVDQCLKLYEGHKIDSLRISFPLDEEDSTHIDSWISSAVRTGAQKLALDFDGPYSSSKNLYEFPSSVLLSESKLFQLKALRLKTCKLKPSPNLGGIFISLKRLHLVGVFLDKTSTDTIISNGLNLEWLNLSSCNLPEALNIETSLLHLTGLILCDCKGVKKINISCRSLIMFEYKGPWVINLSFHEMPHLENLDICFRRDYIKPVEYTLNKFFPAVPNLGGVYKALKKLHLVEVSLDKTSTDTIISNGSNLEWLNLSSCSLPETLNIEASLIHLKGLIFCDCKGVEKIDICCKSLIIFKYKGPCVINLSFHEVPHLENVHICFGPDYTKALEYAFNKLSRDVPHLQHLSLYTPVSSPPLSITKFYHLKQMDLVLDHRHVKFNLLSITFILDAAPHLQKLCLSIKCSCREAEQQNYLDYVHNHLKEVEVNGFEGAANEMEFVIYLLKNVVALEKMTLSPRASKYNDYGWVYKFHLSEEEKQNVHDSLKGLIKCNTELILGMHGVSCLVSTHVLLKKNDIPTFLINPIHPPADVTWVQNGNVS